MLYNANTLNWCINYTKQVTYCRVSLKAVQCWYATAINTLSLISRLLQVIFVFIFAIVFRPTKYKLMTKLHLLTANATTLNMNEHRQGKSHFSCFIKTCNTEASSVGNLSCKGFNQGYLYYTNFSVSPKTTSNLYWREFYQKYLFYRFIFKI